MALTQQQINDAAARFLAVFGAQGLSDPAKWSVVTNQWNNVDPATAAANGVGGPIDPNTGLPSGQRADAGIFSVFGGNPMANWGILQPGQTPSMADIQALYNLVAPHLSGTQLGLFSNAIKPGWGGTGGASAGAGGGGGGASGSNFSGLPVRPIDPATGSPPGLPPWMRPGPWTQGPPAPDMFENPPPLPFPRRRRPAGY